MKWRPKLAVFITFILVLEMTLCFLVFQARASDIEDLTVVLETSMGDITIRLRDDMPITTGNFLSLLHEGVYDNTIFHRVIPDFMIQGGDPNGNGYSDDGIPNILDEFSENPEKNRNLRGTIAMANTGFPNSGSSQFFINVVYNSHLDYHHPVFGEVIEGMDVVDAISNVETDANDRPLDPITINDTQVIPEFPSWIILPLVLTTTVIALLFRNRLFRARAT
jgi:peptidylprolyl isomerase